MRPTEVQIITTEPFSELMQAAADEGRLLELAHGEVVEKMPSEAHGAHVGVEVRHEAPADPYDSLREKALYYLRYGARMVWLVYSSAQQVEVCALNGHGNLTLHTASTGDMLTAGDVLPGFQLSLNHFFQDLPKP